MYKKDYQEIAFPVVSEQYGLQEGMTLLDYFAAKAMQEVVNKSPNINCSSIGGNAGVANYSYQIAAAMMEERKKYLKQG